MENPTPPSAIWVDTEEALQSMLQDIEVQYTSSYYSSIREPCHAIHCIILCLWCMSSETGRINRTGSAWDVRLYLYDGCHARAQLLAVMAAAQCLVALSPSLAIMNGISIIDSLKVSCLSVLETCSCVDEKAPLMSRCSHGQGYREIAVDLEAHSWRSFHGLLCLMQLRYYCNHVTHYTLSISVYSQKRCDVVQDRRV